MPVFASASSVFRSHGRHDPLGACRSTAIPVGCTDFATPLGSVRCSVVGRIALAVLVCEPNILAHGALVTTDTAETAMMFGTVYTFYRYLKQPSFTRLLVCSLFAGLALSVKHSGLLIFPILLVLIAVYLVLASRVQSKTPRTFARHAAFAFGSLLFIAAASVTILWSCYGFRYAARPGNAQITPPTAAFLKTLDRPAEARFIGFS